MKFFTPDSSPDFPKLKIAEQNGLIAIGGILEPNWLIKAYKNGIFPWFHDKPILWWGPTPRAIMKPSEINIHKSMRSYLNQNKFDLKIDYNFENIILNCANSRAKQEGTWINSEMIQAYIKLHHLGYAHSFESWKKGKLVGGLYGVSIGKIFFGESMFSFENNSSKFAFIKMCQILDYNRFSFIDCQFQTEHLKSLGCRLRNLNEFEKILSENNKQRTIIGNWSKLLNLQ